MKLDKSTIKKIRSGYFSAEYFLKTQKILLRENNLSEVTMQVFQKNDNGVVCGIEEVLSILKEGTGIYKNGKWIDMSGKLKIETLKDGDVISRNEPAMHVTGPYVYFAHLESLYLGILARRTLVASNSRQAVEKAKGKPIYFFADRFDDFLNQEGDGYAAHIGGVTGVCTGAQAVWWNGKPIGTIPHSLIAIYNGDTKKAVQLFLDNFPKERLIALVDFNNDCVKTSLEIAKQFGKKLWGVRLDTAENLIDKSLENKPSNRGVSSSLVFKVREELNKNGFDFVKIIVSGGFNAERIERFEKENVPVDVYAVGSTLVKGNNDFTADIVKVNGKLIAKEGRGFIKNKGLKIAKL